MNAIRPIWFLLALSWLAISPSLAQLPLNATDSDVLQLPVAGTVEALKQQAMVLPVSEASDDLEALFDAEGFLPWDESLEESAPPIWLRLHLASPADSRNDWLLKIQRRFFPQLEIQMLDPATGHIVRHSLGLDEYIPGQISGREYIVPMNLESGGERIVLMRVETLQGSLSALSFSVEDELTFNRDQNTRYWVFGLYFGFVIALLIYNLTLYLNLRTPGHRMYVITISAVLVFMGMDSGILQGWLPDALRLRELPMFVASAALMTAASLRFFQVFAEAKTLVPRLNYLITFFCLLLLLLTFLILCSPLAWSAWQGPMIQAVMSLATMTLLVSSLIGAIRGSNASLVFFIAWAAFLSGSLLRSLLSMDWLPRLPVAEYMVYVGSVLEAMILALGLSYRVGQLRVQRNRAEREQLRAMELANLDSLTGAYNRRFFDSYLSGLMDTSDGKDQRSALLLFDIDHFKETNDEYGHDAGDAVLQALTQRCRNELRSGDVLCRLGGDEFAVILASLEDETAVQVAERLHRIVARNPVMHQGHVIKVTISVGVLSPLATVSDEAEALRAADYALYEAKRAGRNQVQMYRINSAQ